jgi:Uma2 family endonuclease
MTPTAVLEPVLAPAPADVDLVDDDALYEIIDGQRVELPPMSAYAARISNRITKIIGQFADANQLGEAVNEVLFKLTLDRDRNRCPDAAFVSFERWPKDMGMPIAGNAWEVTPDLAVEVVSPTDRVEELREKIAEYFEAGVRLVWVVHPLLQLVDVYESLIQIRGLTRTDTLDGGSVLPGFRTPVAALFPGTAPPV